MSWLETLSDVVSLGNVHSAATSYIRGQIIQQAVRAGASANSILNALTGAGMGIRRSQGLSLVSAEQARQLSGATANQVAFNSPASELLGTTAPANWSGQYVHQVTATYRTRDDEGNYILHTRTLGIKSSTVLSPTTAVNAAQQIMSSEVPSDEEGEYPLPDDIMSMSLSGVWYDTQNRNLTRVTP